VHTQVPEQDCTKLKMGYIDFEEINQGD